MDRMDLEISLRFGAMWNCRSLDFVYWKEEAPLVLEKECFERLVTLLGRFRGMPVRAIACNLCLRPTSMALIVASHPLVFSSSRHAHDLLSSRNAARFSSRKLRGFERRRKHRGHCCDPVLSWISNLLGWIIVALEHAFVNIFGCNDTCFAFG